MTRIEELETQIRMLKDELNEERNRCHHTRITYEYKSNTGNYDPTCDSYWVNVKCIDCNHRMTFDSDEDNTNYRMVGEIGSQGRVETHDYDTYLKVKGILE
ncbi:hypothetical protein VPFG_00250 [Vibrio phage nt-1]|uniref:Uncharacterized protein n=1 Tax=Vibrio phage nt-1 TaxID=115992 RepID=R9TFJ2_9CAUD|nr:hypothetical protein VPFG_00250 [Vibrio phage nt-1]AGN30249.1 hypothetical protein VPFG_00250 [Vibrio phage nt-1]